MEQLSESCSAAFSSIHGVHVLLMRIFENAMKTLERIPIQRPQLLGIIAGLCVFSTSVTIVVLLLWKSGTLRGALNQIKDEASGVAGEEDTKKGVGSLLNGRNTGAPLFDRVIETAASTPLIPKIPQAGSPEELKSSHLQATLVVPLDCDVHSSELCKVSDGRALFHESAYDAKESLWKREHR